MRGVLKKYFVVKFLFPIWININRELRSVLKIISFYGDMVKYNRLSDKRRDAKIEDIYPCLHDNTSQLGFEPHYTYHTAWAARVIKKIGADNHTDISSQFSAMAIISAFVPVDYYEYRPEVFNLDNISTNEADLLKIPIDDGVVKSLSCMHVLEHVGLGRYGDNIDPYGDVKAAKEIKRILAINGDLILVVPVGIPKVMYNAHRIYSYEEVLELFGELYLEEFSLVPDNYKELGMIKNAKPEIVAKQNWGCGCFWFKKSFNDRRSE